MNTEEVSMLRMHCNENPYGPPPNVFKAVEEELDARTSVYPDHESTELRRRIADYHKITADMVAAGNGVDELIILTSVAFSKPGDKVLVTETSFPGYVNAARTVGSSPRTIPLQDYRVPLDKVSAAMHEDAVTLAFVCNPHNPTGTVLTPAEADRLIEQAEQAGTVLVLDEAYMEFAGAEYESGVPAVLDGRSVIVLRTFSKAWGLAGLRVGYAVGPAKLISRIREARQVMPFGVNALAQCAATAALDTPGYLDEVRSRNAAGRQRIYDGVRAAGLDYVPSETNFVMVHTGRKDSAVLDRLSEEHGVVVRDLALFDMPGAIRVTVGTPEENERFCSALREVVRHPEPDADLTGGIGSIHAELRLPQLEPSDPATLFNGYTAASVIFALEKLGVWERLSQGPWPVGELARVAGAETARVRVLLRVMALVGHVRLTDDVVALTEVGEELVRQRGFFIWGVGAYGEILHSMAAIATGKSSFGVDVGRDENLIATAGGLINNTLMRPIEDRVLTELQFDAVADLGCGNATRLIRFCSMDPTRRGLGIDISRSACAAATQRVKDAGLDDRLRIVCDDVLNYVDEQVYPGYDLVTSFLMMHDLFAACGDPAKAIRTVRNAFPDAERFLIADTPAQDWEHYEGSLPLFSVEFELVHSFMNTPILDRVRYEAAFTEAGLHIEWREPFGAPSTYLYLLTAK